MDTIVKQLLAQIWKAKTVAVALLTFSVAHSDAQSCAQDCVIGLRGGVSFDKDTGYFRQVEVITGASLPWKHDCGLGLELIPQLEGSAGWISGGSEDGFIATAGPAIELRKGDFPITLIGGASPTFLSRYNFGESNLGGRFQFTDHIGLEWHIAKAFSLGWRFQHMSNAGIYKRNPGLNLQMFSASYNF